MAFLYTTTRLPTTQIRETTPKLQDVLTPLSFDTSTQLPVVGACDCQCSHATAIGLTFFLTLLFTILLCMAIFYLYLKRQKNRRENQYSTSKNADGEIAVPTSDSGDKNDLIVPEDDIVVGGQTNTVSYEDENYVVPISQSVDVVNETNQAKSKEQAIEPTGKDKISSDKTPKKNDNKNSDVGEVKTKDVKQNNGEKDAGKNKKKQSKDDLKTVNNNDKDVKVGEENRGETKAKPVVGDNVDGALYENVKSGEPPSPTGEEVRYTKNKENKGGNEKTKKKKEEKVKSHDAKADVKKEKKKKDDKKDKRMTLPVYINVNKPIHSRPKSAIPNLGELAASDEMYTVIDDGATDSNIYLEPVPSPTDNQEGYETMTGGHTVDDYDIVYDYPDANFAKKNDDGDDVYIVPDQTSPVPGKIQVPSTFIQTREPEKKVVDDDQIKSVNVKSLIKGYKQLDEETATKSQTLPGKIRSPSDS